MDPLTSKQEEILNFIDDFQRSKGVAPTLKEISSGFSVCIGTVQSHIRALQKKGYLNIESNVHRGIRLPTRKREWEAHREGRGDFEERIGAKLKGETDLHKIFQTVRGEMQTWLGVDRADLFVYDINRRELRGSSFFGVHFPGEPDVQQPESIADSISGHAFRRRKPVVETEAGRTKVFETERDARPGLKACAAIPILGRDRVLGILRLDHRANPAFFEEGVTGRASLAAAALAPTLEQGTLNAELQQRIRLQTALVALCRTINSTSDFQKILHDIYDIVRSLVDAPVFIIAVRDDAGQWWFLLETDVIEGKAWEDNNPHRADIGQNEALRTLQIQPYYIKHRTPEEVRILESRGPNFTGAGWLPVGNVTKRSGSILYVPLKSGSEMMGYLSAQSYAFNAYSIQDAENLMLIGEYIGLAVQNAWRKEKERARLDAAEKLLNRLDRMEEELKSLAQASGEGRTRTRLESLAAEMASFRPDRQGPAAYLTRS